MLFMSFFVWVKFKLFVLSFFQFAEEFSNLICHRVTEYVHLYIFCTKVYYIRLFS
jgi:hypothetical protein